MTYRAGSRAEVVAALLVARGYVEDPGGRATLRLINVLVDRIGVDPRTVQSVSELLGAMDRDEVITRTIKGRRTYSIALHAPTAGLLRDAMRLLALVNTDRDLDPVGDPGDLVLEAGFDVPNDAISDRSPQVAMPLNFHNLDRLVVVSQQIVQTLRAQQEHINRLSVDLERWQRRAERAEAEVEALRVGRVSGGG